MQQQGQQACDDRFNLVTLQVYSVFPKSLEDANDAAATTHATAAPTSSAGTMDSTFPAAATAANDATESTAIGCHRLHARRPGYSIERPQRSSQPESTATTTGSGTAAAARLRNMTYVPNCL